MQKIYHHFLTLVAILIGTAAVAQNPDVTVANDGTPFCSGESANFTINVVQNGSPLGASFTLYYNVNGGSALSVAYSAYGDKTVSVSNITAATTLTVDSIIDNGTTDVYTFAGVDATIPVGQINPNPTKNDFSVVSVNTAETDDFVFAYDVTATAAPYTINYEIDNISKVANGLATATGNINFNDGTLNNQVGTYNIDFINVVDNNGCKSVDVDERVGTVTVNPQPKVVSYSLVAGPNGGTTVSNTYCAGDDFVVNVEFTGNGIISGVYDVQFFVAGAATLVVDDAVINPVMSGGSILGTISVSTSGIVNDIDSVRIDFSSVQSDLGGGVIVTNNNPLDSTDFVVGEKDIHQERGITSTRLNDAADATVASICDEEVLNLEVVTSNTVGVINFDYTFNGVATTGTADVAGDDVTNLQLDPSYTVGNNNAIIITQVQDDFCTYTPSANQTANVVVNQKPTVNLTGPTALCENDIYTFNVDYTGTGNFDFVYQLLDNTDALIHQFPLEANDNDGTLSFDPNDYDGAASSIIPGADYSILAFSLADDNGCTSNAAYLNQKITFTYKTRPTAAANFGAPTEICSGDNASLDFVLTGTAPFTITLDSISNINGLGDQNRGQVTYTINGLAGSQVLVPTTTDPTVYKYDIREISDSDACGNTYAAGVNPTNSLTVNVNPTLVSIVQLEDSVCNNNKNDLVFTVTASGSGDYTISGIVEDDAAVQQPFTFSSAGAGSPFNINLNDSVTLNSGKHYTVTFNNLEDNRNTVGTNDDCDIAINEVFDINVFKLPQVTSFSIVESDNIANPLNTICFGEDAKLLFDLNGFGTTTLSLNRVSAANPSLNGVVNVTYPNLDNGPNTVAYPNQEFLVSPFDSVTYELVNISSTVGNITCSRAIAFGPNPLHVNDIPKGDIAINTSEVCRDGVNNMIEVTVSVLSGDDATGFRFNIENGATLIADSINSPNTSKTLAPFAVQDSSYIYLRNFEGRDGFLCSGADDSVFVKVNPLPDVELLTPDTFVCEGEQAGFRVLLTGVAPFNISFDAESAPTVGNTETISVLGTEAGNYVNKREVFIPISGIAAGGDTAFTITAVADAVCANLTPTDDGERVVIVINKTPVISFISPANVCFGKDNPLTVSVSGGNANDFVLAQQTSLDYTINYKNGGVFSTGTFGAVNSVPANRNTPELFNLMNDTSFVLTAITDVTFGCTGVVNTEFKVAVSDEISASISGPDTVCNGVDVPVTASLPDGLEYQMTFDVNGTTVVKTGVQNNDILTFATGGGAFAIDSIKLQSVAFNDGSCSTVILDTVVSLEQVVPVAEISINQNDIQVCKFSNTEFTVDFTTGTGLIYLDYQDATGTITGTVSGLAGTTQTVTIPALAVGNYTFSRTRVYSKASNSECDGLAAGGNTAVVTVRDLPQVSFVPSKTAVCDNDNVIFKGTFTEVANSSATEYDVVYEINNEGDVTERLNPGLGNDEIVISRVGSYSIRFKTITEADGASVNCINNINQNFNIGVSPRPSVVMTGDAALCEQVPAPIDLDFTGTAPFNVVISNFGSFVAFNDTTITVTPSTTTTYQVTSLTDASGAGCAGAVTTPAVTITITEKPDVTFTPSANPICEGETVDLNIVFTNGTSPEYNVKYQVGSNPVIAHPTASVAGSLTITLPAQNTDANIKLVEVSDNSSPACIFTETANFNLTVRETPKATLTASATELCEGEDLQLDLLVEGRAGKNIDYVVTDNALNVVGSGTVAAGTTVSLAQQDSMFADTTYTVMVQYTDGTPSCANSVETLDITVNPRATINFNGPGVYCQGETVPYTIEYLTGDGDIFVELRSPQTGQILNVNNTVGNTVPYGWVPNDTGMVDLNIQSITSVSPNGNVCQNTTVVPAGITFTIRPTPIAEIDANQYTIVNGGSTQLVFAGSGYLGAGAGNVFIDYTANGTPVNPSAQLDGAPQYPDTVRITVAPTTTTTYEITDVRQNSGAINGACSNTQRDDVTITVVNGKTAAISGDDDICLSECVDLYFSFANPVSTYQVIIQDGSGRLDTLNNVSDNTPTQFCPRFSGALQYTIFEVTDALNNTTTDPNEFAGLATIEVAESKTVTLVGDTIICEGQPGAFSINISGSGEFTIPYSITPSGSQRIVSLSDNDNGTTRIISANELRLGENIVDYSGTVTNSLNNACPINQVGTAKIYVKPTPTGDFRIDPIEPCEGTDFDVFLDASPDSLFDITYLDLAGTAQTVTGVASDGLLNTITASVDGRFTLTSIRYSDMPACANNTVVQRQLNVKRAPVAAIVTPDNEICNGDAFDIVVRLTNVDEYPVSFTYNDGIKDSIVTFVNPNNLSDTVITVNPTTTTTYTLVRVNDGNMPTCNGTISIGQEDVVVTVGAPLILNDFRITIDTICKSESFNYIVDVNGDLPITAFFSGTENFSVAITQQGVSTFTRVPTGDYTLKLDRLVDANGCVLNVDQEEELQVIDKPTLFFSANKTSLCFGDSIRLRVTVTAEDTVVATFQAPGTPIFAVDTNYTLAPGTQFVWLKPRQTGDPIVVTVERVAYLRSRGGCESEDVQVQNFNVYELPTASIFVGGGKDTTLCQGDLVDLDFVTNSTKSTTIFFDNTNGLPDFVSFSGSTNGSKTVSPAVGMNKYYITQVTSDNNGTSCSAQDIIDTAFVQVYQTPTVAITGTNNPRCLNGAASVVTFNFSGNGPFVFDYTDGQNTFTRTATIDNDGDGKLDIQISVAPGTTTTYCVTRIQDATSPSACVNLSANCYTISVNQQPEAELFNGDDQVCKGESVTLNYFLRGRAPLSVRFTYNGTRTGVASVSGDTVLTGLSTGLNTITLTFDQARDYIVTIDSIADSNVPQCTTGATLGFALVEVDPIPSVNTFDLDFDNLCKGESAMLSVIPNTFGGIFEYPYAITYLANGASVTDTIVDGPSSFFVVKPNITTTYRLVSIRNLNTGCDSTYSPSNPFVQTLTIHDNPTIDFKVNPSNICSVDDINLEVTVTGTESFLFEPFVNGSSRGVRAIANSGVTENINLGAADAPLAGFDKSFVTIRDLSDNSAGINGTPNNCIAQPLDTAFFQVNPQATANFADINTVVICEGDQIDLPITITGSGTVLVDIEVRRLSDNAVIRTDRVTGLASAGTIVYSDNPTEGVRYEITVVSSETGGVACAGLAGNAKVVDVRNTPRVSIAFDPTTICEDETVKVTYTITGQGPFDFTRTKVENGLADEVAEFFSEKSPVVEFVQLRDTAVFYVDTIIRRQNPMCFNTDSVGKQINVNPKAKATFVATDTTFCEGEQAGFNITLSGQGAITILYNSNISPTIRTYTNVAGTYFIPVTQPAGTTARWSVISIDDQSNPRCVNPNGTGFTDITITQTPKAAFSGNFEICEGGTAAINVNISGQSNDQIEVFYSDTLNPGFVSPTSSGVYTNFPGSYGILLAGMDTNRVYVIDSVRYVNFGCTVTRDQIAPVGQGIINVRPSPEASITSPQLDLCKFDQVDFTFNFPFPGPYNMSYSINGAPTQTENDINDGFVRSIPNASDTVKIVLTSLVYRDIPQCVNENVDSLTVFVNDTLEVSMVETLCNDSATGFRFVVDLVGGQPNTYTYTNNLTGETATLVGPRDTLPEILNGNYDFTISDGSGCPAVDFVDFYECACLSSAGVFTNTATVQDFCGDIVADVSALYDNTSEFLDANDVLVYVLHTNSGPSLGTILAVNSGATFARNTLPTNTVYYVSAVVADENAAVANGFDVNDRCISVSEGVPIQWLDISTLTVELTPNDSGFFCNQSLLNYDFILTSPGAGDFTVTFNDGTGADRTETISGTGRFSFSSLAPATVDGQLEILSFTDASNANNCFTVVTPIEPYTIQQLPTATFTGDPRICGNELIEDSETAVFTADEVGNFAYDWIFTNGTPVTGDEQIENIQYDVAGTHPVALTVTNVFGCQQTTASSIDVTIAEKPILNDDTISKVCLDDLITFVASNLITTGAGKNSDQIEWIIDGVSLQTSGSNTFDAPTFDERRPYELVVTNYFNNCTASDTFRFTVIGPVVDEPLVFNDICSDTELNLFLTNPDNVSTATWTVQGAPGTTVKTNTTGANGTSTFLIEELFPQNHTVDITLEIESSEGCTRTITTSSVVNDVSVTAQYIVPDQEGPNGTVDLLEYCEGYAVNVQLDPAAPLVGNNLTYSWNLGRGQITLPGAGPFSPQTITGVGRSSIVLTATDDNGCTDIDSVSFEILERPEITVETSLFQDTICSGNTPVSLSAAGATNYAWNTDTNFVAGTDLTSANVTLKLLTEGRYNFTVIGRDDKFCYDTTTINVSSFDVADPRDFLSTTLRDIDTTFALGYELEVDFALGNPAYQYAWSPEEGVTFPDFPITDIYTLEDRLYTLTISDIFNCFNEVNVDVNINLLREYTLDVPDAFSPNGDGINEVIYPDGWALDEVLEFQVYNNGGLLLWTGTGTKEEAAWDGTYNGEPQPVNTYAYKIKVRTLLGTTELKSGTFSLMR